MSHRFLKVACVSLLAIGVILFANNLRSATNPLLATPVPSGTYWNWDAGFGDSELVFLEGSRYTSGAIGAVSVEGTYALTQEQIVFIEYGPADAPCLHIAGTYEWRLNRNVLTLQELDDPCSTRQFDWRSGLWVWQPVTLSTE